MILALLATAILTKDIRQASLDSSVIAGIDTVCTYRVRSGSPITDQKETGRCWYFSTTNILRAETGLEDFQFSQTFGQYWDLYEKCNRWLEYAAKYRRRPLRSRIVVTLFKKPIGDGGHFSNAAHLIDKYGAIPHEVMPELYAGSNDASMMRTLLTVLRRAGVKMRHCRCSEVAGIKEQAMSDVKTILDKCLGVPPEFFEWRGVTFTPRTFADAYIRHDMENDYAVLMNDPTLPYYRTYSVRWSRNCYEYPDWTFLNLPMEALDSIGVASLRGGRMFYASIDSYQYGYDTLGIYDSRIYKASKALGVDLSMSKKEMFESIETFSAHGVAVCGVKLSSGGPEIERWLVENSFGPVRGWGGFVVMSGEWFDKFAFRMVVEKRFVPDKYASLLGKRPRRLPPWNPLY
ncbi:MAG: hypothetical protein IJU69_05465 [Bacteroidales bacterium]|nr:hypothetical protein [Bacteroidales bacterium]